MLSDDELIQQFNTNLTRFYETGGQQRDEIHLAFRYLDGNQYDTLQRGERRAATKPLYTLNIGAPMVRAIAGSEIMTATTLEFTSTDPDFDDDADIIGDVVEWCQEASNYYAQRALAASDAATCGIGAYVTYLDMTKADFIAGFPQCERIFPNFCAWDNSPRGALLNEKAWWCSYADPVDSSWLESYLKDKDILATGASDFKEWLLSGQIIANHEHIAFVHHYFWKEYVDLYDIKNPFDERLGQAAVRDADIANMIGEVEKQLFIDFDASYWTLDKEGYETMKAMVEVAQGLLPEMMIADLEYSKRKGLAYYRAEFAGGNLIKKSRSFCQTGHLLNFIPGYFEESTSIYYGFMRPISQVLDPLNIAFSDLMSYVNKASHGGASYIAGAGEAIERIIKDKVNEDDITPVPKGTEIVPKALPNSPQVLQSTVSFLVDVMPRVLGLGQEFFGVITTGDMTDSLFGKVMKQSFAVLEHWKASSQGSDIKQARIWESLARLMAEANDGMVIDSVSGEDGTQQQRLSRQNLARSYSVKAIERPMTKDEKQDSFNKLMQLAPQMAQTGMNIYPALMKMAPLDQDIRNDLLQAITPQPAPPDPLNQATIQSQIDYTIASAEKLKADAAKTQAEVALMKETAMAEKLAEIEYTAARSDNQQASAAKSMAGIEAEQFDQAMQAAKLATSTINEVNNGRSV